MRIDDATLARLMLRAQDGDAVAYRQVLETSRGWLGGSSPGGLRPARSTIWCRRS